MPTSNDFLRKPEGGTNIRIMHYLLDFSKPHYELG